MSADDWYDDLIDFLDAKGHTKDEIGKIVDKIKEYDLQTQHDSVMDSLDAGSFNLSEIIDEALKDT
jgi:hypothetical protein